LRHSSAKEDDKHLPSDGVHVTRIFKPAGRSRITNGRQLLPDVDGRTLWVRRFKDVRALHLSDLGGEANTSAAEQSLVRRAAALTVELERLEVKFAQGREAAPADLELYQGGMNTLRRVFETLGLQRRQRDITPSVEDYVRHLNEQHGGDA
jgi:hypothetical protein